MREKSDLSPPSVPDPQYPDDDQAEIDRWHDDGNQNFPDESDEVVRQKKSKLRDWACRRFTSVAEFELVLDVINGNLTCPDLAFDCHRITAWRRLRRLLSRIRKEVDSDPAVQASMPSPWRERLFGERKYDPEVD